MVSLSELFKSVIKYGKYVRENRLDGLRYWNNLKNIISTKNLQEINKILGNTWNIKISIGDTETNNLDIVYNHVHDELEMHGDDNDSKDDKEKWDKNHFFLQLVRIPKNNELNLLRILQIAYNIGQLSVHLNDKETYSEVAIDFYDRNKLGKMETYIEGNKIIDIEIISILEEINTYIKKTINIFCADIEQITMDNNSYRKVLYTGTRQQFVLMSITPGDNIPKEIHPDTDQFIRVEEGNGLAIVEGINYELKDNIGIIIPAGKEHEIKNTGSTNLKLYSIYSPPEHEQGLIQETKPDKEHDLSEKQKYYKYKSKYIKLKNKYNKQ
jgi:mannose-6-phosphate isomerase-like protein (cupin superfamily)